MAVVISLFEGVADDLVVPFARNTSMTDDDGSGSKLGLLQSFWLDTSDEDASISGGDDQQKGCDDGGRGELHGKSLGWLGELRAMDL